MFAFQSPVESAFGPVSPSWVWRTIRALSPAYRVEVAFAVDDVACVEAPVGRRRLVGRVGAAGAADQVVLAVAAEDRVRVGVAEREVVVAAALDPVVAALAVEPVVAVLAADRVAAGGSRRRGRARGCDVGELDPADDDVRSVEPEGVAVVAGAAVRLGRAVASRGTRPVGVVAGRDVRALAAPDVGALASATPPVPWLVPPIRSSWPASP